MLAFGPTHPYIAAEIYSSISTKAEQFPALCASVIPQQWLSAQFNKAGETHDEYATGLQVINQDRVPALEHRSDESPP